jgi:acyl carrier protein
VHPYRKKPTCSRFFQKAGPNIYDRAYMTDLLTIVSETLNIAKSLVVDTLARDKTPEWDSFNHLLLIAEIEKRLKVTFTLQEVSSIQTYKDLKSVVDKKIE